MKKGLTYLLAGILVVTLSTVGFAGKKGHDEKKGSIKGEVTKIDGEMITITDDHGKEHMLHMDKTTEKEGELKEGVHVEAEATDSGHAKAIKVHMMEEEVKPH